MQGVPLDKCHVTGLGVESQEYTFVRQMIGDEQADELFLHLDNITKIPGRILVGNDPQRGLWHVLDIFDEVKARVPHATLHITYDVLKVFDTLRWQAHAMSQLLLDCERRINADPAITLLGNVSRAELIREQLECQVHVWPSDPPNIGSQIHGGIMGMECAAAGAAIVVSDVEAMPETFGGVATILPVPGTYIPSAERRLTAEDWAEAVVELMLDPDKWAGASRKARALAEQNTWPRVIERWEKMFETLAEGYAKKVREASELAAVH